MKRMSAALVLPLALAAALRAAPQLALDVTPDGAVNVTVDGKRCVDDLRLLLPAPAWQGGATPREVVRDLTEPGHIRVKGAMADGTPCATFSLDMHQDETGVDLVWELQFSRDFAAETVRLNALVPCALAAGKGAWFIRRPESLDWGLLPATYGDPGGYLNDWGFDWFGWLLPDGVGVRFLPRRGLNEFYQQDGRQWGGDSFQCCWTMAGKGTVRQGAVLRAALRLEPLAAADLRQDADRLGLSLLAAGGVLRLAGEGPGVEGHIEVRNVLPESRTLSLAWEISDDLATVLVRSSQAVVAPGLGVLQVPVAAPETPSGDYRLQAEVGWRQDAAPEVVAARLVAPPPGPRAALSLDGSWELAPGGKTDAPRADAAAVWKPVTVPSPIAGSTERCYWYRRTFEAPAAMAGKRLDLEFGAANHAARVYVNGRLAGEHRGGNLPFALDITELVQPAQTNELTVAVSDWRVFCTQPPDPFVVEPFEHPGWKIPRGTVIAPIGGDFRLTGIWQGVTLRAHEPVWIEDVTVQTSTRTHTLRVTTRVHNRSDRARDLQMTNRVEDRDGPALPLPDSRFTVGPGEHREVMIEARWRRPHLWSLDDPHLYRLTTHLREEGALLDAVHTRFGFREVWTEGPRVVLNGLPLKLFATSGWSMETWSAARDRLLRLKRAGTRSLRLHTQPWQPHILDVADELGMLIVDEAAVYCYAQSYAPEDERFWQNYAEHACALARRDRNHPSLAIYSLENEIISCGGDPKVWEPRLGALADTLRSVDPTRLITCESDLDPGGRMDVIGMHYPHEYWSGFTLYPDKCWWLDREISYLNRPWKWQRDKPLYIGEFDGGFMAWYPQYQAFWLGDEAYTARGHFSSVSPNSRARRELIGLEVAAYRAADVCGLNPWFDLDEVEAFGPAAYAPITVAIREQTHSFYSGQEIHRTLWVYNDSAKRARLKLTWQLALPQGKPQSGSSSASLKPCTAEERHVTLTAPPVTARTDATFTVELRHDGRVVSTTQQTLALRPRRSPADAPASGVVLFDPAGKTAPALGAAGLRVEALASLDGPPAGTRAVIIGAGALSSGETPWAGRLAEFVAAGNTVVCLEQESYPTTWLPLAVEMDSRHETVVAFTRARNHPILAGIADAGLRFWQPDHRVARRSLLKPTRGNAVAIIDAGGIRAAVDDLNGLSWAPLLELPYGRGRYLLCQLLVSERAGIEPVATNLLRALVTYAAEAGPNPTTAVGLVAEPDGSLKRAVDALGLVYEGLTAALGQTALARVQVLVAGGGARAWTALRAHAAELRPWLAAGGVLWLNNLSPDEADLVAALAGVECRFQPAELVAPVLTVPDPFTAGLSNHELYWRDRPIWDQMTALRRTVESLPLLPESSATALTDPPALVRFPVGKGCLLLNQVLWDSTDQNRREGLRLASILLTNLGATLDLSPLGPRRPEAFVPVNLAPYCNLELAGDPGPVGWMDHGPTALQGLPAGDTVLAGVPFHLVKPEENAGRAVVALRGKTRPAYPTQATGIALECRVRALHFLHACGWGMKEGTAAVQYVVRYADGAERTIPIRVGLEIGDWYADPQPLPYAEVAWRGHSPDKPGAIGIYRYRWVNPEPARPISSMAVVSAVGEPVPVLFAVTVEKP